MGLPADFHSFCPYWKGAKPSREARSRYMPALTAKVNCPPRLARTDRGAPPTPSTGRSVTSARASGRPVDRSSTTPRITAPYATQQQSAARSNLSIDREYPFSPWRAANLGRSRLLRRPEPAESRLRTELPALQYPLSIMTRGRPETRI